MISRGFVPGEIFDRNKCMVSLPADWKKSKAKGKAGGKGALGGKGGKSKAKAAVEEQAPFNPPFNVGSKQALKLQEEVLKHLRATNECDMGALRAVNDLGKRFNECFFQKSKVNDGSWKRWLASLPGVQVAVDPRVASFHGNKPT
ncbi:unnamed protein product, partial [Polarella glacialis]